MISAFPAPGVLILDAYRDLQDAELGPLAPVMWGQRPVLPRPWDPGSVHEPDLRDALWSWLEDVVAWLNHEHTWDVGALVPPCWPAHPHLVHELAVLADRRWHAGLAPTSDPLEEWHRSCLPTFTARMKDRLRAQCHDGHQPWPGRAREHEYASPSLAELRRTAQARDLETLLVESPRGV